MYDYTPQNFLEHFLPPGFLWCDTDHDPDPTWCVEMVRDTFAGKYPAPLLTNLGYEDGGTGELRVVPVGRN